jgi:hypothetical protein
VRRIVALIGAAMLAVPVAATAHRGHASLSVVEIDAATGAVTVTHRMAAHDVEPALSVIAPDVQQSLDDPAAIAALEAYAGRAFQLWDADGKPVALSRQATKVAGDHLELISAGQLPAPARTLSVDSNLFEEAHDDQENQVNVRRGKVTRTAVFRLGDGAQRIDFE